MDRFKELQVNAFVNVYQVSKVYIVNLKFYVQKLNLKIFAKIMV